MSIDATKPQSKGPSVKFKPLNPPASSGTGTNPDPFTYEHFTQALWSLKDGMLMFYIDEAVGIYCRLRGITVGPRPASSKDYSLEYADAFEAANCAVYTVATKMGSFSPDKGAFRPYLDRALENALKDILKADGYGDFFDQTSKKKNKDDEPEKHSKVHVDRFQVDSDSEPDTAASDRAERIRKHKDDALETMIKFIDGLSDINRAAIYASAFGQILRPDIEGFGRNYADILAKVYDTTASYIRQLAAKGKREALAEARRLGFNERSMSEISMGYLQVRTDVPVINKDDINDKVLRSTEQLAPYRQFMLLRHLAGMVENSEEIK